MKKLLLVMTLFIGLGFAGCADDDRAESCSSKTIVGNAQAAIENSCAKLPTN